MTRLMDTRSLLLFRSRKSNGFNPSDIVPSGTPLSWMDFDSMANMWQDIGGTIPVTDLYQPVGRFVDKTGKAFITSTANNSNRPMLSVYSGKMCLYCNGNQDIQSVEPIDMSGVDEVTAVASAHFFQSTPATTEFMIKADGTTSDYNTFRMSRLVSGRIEGVVRSDESGVFLTQPVQLGPHRWVLSFRASISSRYFSLHIEGDDPVTSSQNIGLGMLSNKKINVAKNFVGNLFGFFVAGTSVSDKNMQKLEDYFSERTPALEAIEGGYKLYEWPLESFLPFSVSFARLSAGTYFNANRTMQTAGNNVARFDHDLVTGETLGILVEGQRTNNVRNNTNVGGVAGTQGTLPNNWSVYAPFTGISRTLGYGYENGMPFVDVRINGTPSTGGSYAIFSEANNVILASLGDIFTASAYVKMAAGSMANVSSFTLGFDEQSGGTWLAGRQVFFTPSSDIHRLLLATGVLSATTNNIKPTFRINVTSAPVDVTMRIIASQVEKNNRESSPILTTATASTRAADQLSFTIPSGVGALRYVFDDNSTQDVAVSAGAYTVPTNLNRSHIRRIISL